MVSKNQWQCYIHCCKNREEFEGRLGIKVNKETIENLLDSGIINYSLGMHDFKICRLGTSWAPIDLGIADLIEELNRRGYRTDYCCSGHTVRKQRKGIDWKYYDKSYYISFAAEQPNKNLQAIFEFLFGEVIGREMTDREFIGAAWDETDKITELRLVRGHEEYLRICLEAVKNNVNLAKLFHTKHIQENKHLLTSIIPCEIPENSRCPKQIKSITLEKPTRDLYFVLRLKKRAK